MLLQEIRRDFRDMTRCREFYFSCLLSTALVFVPLFLSLFTFYQKDIVYIEPAYLYWGADGTGYYWNTTYSPTTTLSSTANTILLMYILPFLAPLAYSYRIFDDRKSGAVQAVLPRTGRRAYYLGNVTVAFLGAFLAVLGPLVLEQLVFLIACPASIPNMVTDAPVQDTYLQTFGNTAGGPLNALQLNHPYLFNLLFCLLPAVLAGLFGAVCALVSLFIKRSRFAVLTGAGIVWLLAGLAVGILNQRLSPHASVLTRGNLAVFPVVAGALALLCAVLGCLAKRQVKDVIL